MGWYCHKLATLMSRQVVSLVKPIPSTSGETLKECWWTFIYGEELEQKKMVMMTMTMRNSTQKQEDFVKKRKSSEGEKKLPFLLTRFIRKENLDKRGCKITEIVEREKKSKQIQYFGINSYQAWIVWFFFFAHDFWPLQISYINQTW